jgi:hypothetical protein
MLPPMMAFLEWLSSASMLGLGAGLAVAVIFILDEAIRLRRRR